MKIKNLRVNFGAIKRIPGKLKNFWNVKSKKQKKGFLVTSGISLTVLITMLTACHNEKIENVKSNTPNTTTSTVTDADEVMGPTTNPITSTTNPSTTTEAIETTTEATTTAPNGFLSDILDGIAIDVKDKLDATLIADQIADSIDDNVVVGSIDENGNDISGAIDGNGEIITEDISISGDYYVAPDGDVYSNSGTYTDSNNQGSTTIIDNGGYSDLYVDANGNYWTSYEEYENSLGNDVIVDIDVPSNDDNINDDNGTNSDNDTSYEAPDGSLWASKDAYEESINPNYVDDDLYVAPDGSLWDSEEMYNDYLKGLEEVNTPNDDEISDPITDETDGYKAPDGTYWNSEEEYKESLNLNDDDVYYAPNGDIYASEEDYNNSINNSVVTTEPDEEQKVTTTAPEESKQETTTTVQETEKPVETTTVQETEKPVETTPVQETEKPVETTPVQETEKPVETTPEQVGGDSTEENNYYTAPDGSVWASYEDYLIFMNDDLENTNEKTR